MSAPDSTQFEMNLKSPEELANTVIELSISNFIAKLFLSRALDEIKSGEPLWNDITEFLAKEKP